MINHKLSNIDVIARILMAAIFVLSGIATFSEQESIQAYMMSFGIPEVLLWPVVFFEIGIGIMLITDIGSRCAGVVLAAFTMITALIFYTGLDIQSKLLFL